MPVKVTALNIYPIKSCAGTALNSARIGLKGIIYDRNWMLVDDMGDALTQREVPQLCLVKPSLSETGENIEIRLNADGMKELQITESKNGGNSGYDSDYDEAEELEVTLFGHHLQAQEVSPSASKWFSSFLNRKARLVRMAPDYTRQVDQNYALRETDQTGFADEFPLLLISQESLNELNNRLDEALPMNRFRPNIVVQGCEAFEEDDWKTIRIADVTFDVVKPCARCTITTTNQATGERGVEPLRTLAQFRKQEGGVMFGQNLVQQGEGRINVTDAVEIIARAN
ncbi:MAG TPA: MOSC N-terminal beta barrel domain-containing protein [Chroococcales cyanobacterium]